MSDHKVNRVLKGYNKVDEKLERELFLDIRLMEGKNLKTKRFDDVQMINQIMTLIQKKVKKHEGETE